MAAESSSNRGKKESTASGLLNSPRLNDDVEDPVKSPPHSPNNSSTRKVSTHLSFQYSYRVYEEMLSLFQLSGISSI